MSKKKYEDFDDDFDYDDDDDKVQIDWAKIFQKLYARKKLFIISFVVTIIVAFPMILTIPKYYLVEVKLAPELCTSSSSISSLMSSFGLSNNSSSSDAIRPTLYPDLMNSKAFLVSLFDIPVQSKDKEINTTYSDYLEKNQKSPIWANVINGILMLLPSDTPEEEQDVLPNAAALTKKQTAIAGAISNNVICEVDKKTGVITIDVKDQDPVICATVADSTCSRLQEFITNYRSKKARQEMLNIEKQYNQAKEDYNIAKQNVENFNDSNWDLVNQDMMVQKQDLANKMQLAFQTMSAFNTQLLQARFKYESSIPVYTVLDGASVPTKPKGPRRSLYAIGILFLVFAMEVTYVLFKDKAKNFIVSLKKKPTEVSVP